MSEVRGQIWVDPEGVSHLGDRYAEHADVYDSHLRSLQYLRTQYKDAWGDDDMGRQFSQKFLSGLDNLEAIVGGVKGTLDYTSSGLRSGGQLYREVDDDARTAGHKMAHDFSNLTVTGGDDSGGTPSEPPASDSATPLAPRTLSRAISEPQPGTPLSGTPLSPTLLEAQSGTPTTPVLAASPGKPADSLRATAGTPAASFGKLLPATEGVVAARPAVSSYVETPEWRTALVGGRPLAEGFRLEALNPMPDGTTRVDANLYDAVSPVGFNSVTAADGTPLDPGGRQFFVVKDNPNADPLADGYRPMPVSFTADGSATTL